MEENNNNQQGQYQQYQAPQQPQGAPQGNQFFQGFKAPNTEEGLKKKFADLKTVAMVLGIINAVLFVIVFFTSYLPAIQIANAAGSLYAAFGYSAGSAAAGKVIAAVVIAAIVSIAFIASLFACMVFAKKEDKKALFLGIIAGGIDILGLVIVAIMGLGFNFFGLIVPVAIIADCILTLNAYNAVRGNK